MEQREGAQEAVIRDRKEGWWTEEWKGFKRLPPSSAPHEPLLHLGGGDRKRADIIQYDWKLSDTRYDRDFVGLGGGGDVG